MTRLTATDFTARYRRRPIDARLLGTSGETIEVQGSALVDGIPSHVIVRSGAYAEIHGLVEHSLTVERDAIAYVHGLVDGPVRLDGALCISDGHVAGRITASTNASLADPTEPPDPA